MGTSAHPVTEAMAYAQHPQYSFPVLSAAEIIHCLTELRIPFT